MSDDEDYEFPEDNACLEECTCDHDSDDHGWGECEVEGCDCEGHWAY